MTKKRVEVSIEQTVLENAKKNIPNLSAFFEECLQHYLGYLNGTFPVGNINEINDKIGKLQVELFLINQNYDVEESIERAENFEKDKAWRFLWNDYRIRLIPDEKLLHEAVETLGIDSETLEDLLDEVYEARDSINTDEWATVKEWYNKVIK